MKKLFSLVVLSNIGHRIHNLNPLRSNLKTFQFCTQRQRYQKMSTNHVNISTIKLNNGLDFPLVGLGTFRTADNKETLVNAIKYAISIGYRHFDCAWLYSNEDVIGGAIKEAIAESNGKVKREDLFIVSKVWNTYHSKASAKQCLEETLKNLDLSYVDLYLVHWPMGFAENMGSFPKDEQGNIIPSDVHYLETYRALEELLAEGKVKSIGVSNFNISQLEEIIKNCQVKPVANQVEAHIYLQNEELAQFCQKNGIALVAYGPIGAPNRSPINPEDPILLQDPVVVRLAEKYSKTPGQICLKFLVQQNIVVIPKSTTPSRIRENADIFDFTISDADFQELRGLERNFRIYALKHLANHKFYPF